MSGSCGCEIDVRAASQNKYKEIIVNVTIDFPRRDPDSDPGGVFVPKTNGYYPVENPEVKHLTKRITKKEWLNR